MYDSLGIPLPSQTRKQIASSIKTKDDSITIEYGNVQVRNCINGFTCYSNIIIHDIFQRQPNYQDCGLFAIANAMAIITKQKTELLNYDVGLMRRHLAGCLEDLMIRHFPAKKRTIKKVTRKTEAMKVYCKCRMPEVKGEKMISCDPATSGFTTNVLPFHHKHGHVCVEL